MNDTERIDRLERAVLRLIEERVAADERILAAVPEGRSVGAPPAEMRELMDIADELRTAPSR